MEPLVIIASAIIYFGIKYYHTTLINSPIIALLTLQIAVAVAIIFIVSSIIEAYGWLAQKEKEMHETAHIFRLIAYPILLLVLLHSLSISIASLLVGAGFLGIVVGLAAQTTLGNVFASLSIMYSRPFNKGEKITIVPTSYGIQAPTYPHGPMMNEITGTVKHVGLIYTKLLRDDMSILYIPNSAINQGLIVNHSRVMEKQIKVRVETQRSTDIESFRKRLVSNLSKQKSELEKLIDLTVKMALISTDDVYGITITARVKVLDYDRLSQWLSETAIKSLVEEERKTGRKR